MNRLSPQRLTTDHGQQTTRTIFVVGGPSSVVKLTRKQQVKRAMAAALRDG